MTFKFYLSKYKIDKLSQFLCPSNILNLKCVPTRSDLILRQAAEVAPPQILGFFGSEGGRIYLRLQSPKFF